MERHERERTGDICDPDRRQAQVTHPLDERLDTAHAVLETELGSHTERHVRHVVPSTPRGVVPPPQVPAADLFRRCSPAHLGRLRVARRFASPWVDVDVSRADE